MKLTKTLTLAQIKKIRTDLDEAEKAAKQKTIAGLRSKIDGMLKKEGLTIEDVYPRVFAKKRSLKPRYANPDDRKMTWSGLGRKPWWVQEHLAGGGKLHDLAI